MPAAARPDIGRLTMSAIRNLTSDATDGVRRVSVLAAGRFAFLDVPAGLRQTISCGVY